MSASLTFCYIFVCSSQVLWRNVLAAALLITSGTERHLTHQQPLMSLGDCSGGWRSPCWLPGVCSMFAASEALRLLERSENVLKIS